LIPRAPFLRDPNAGHYATADFLATGVIDFAVSTNVDTLIEVAAEELGEAQAFVAINAGEANITRPHRPHIKLHGCLRLNAHETVWCKSQLRKAPIQSRLRELDTWLRSHLVGRDVVFLGFWSDWAYLNQIFETSIDAIEGGFVVIVNPSDEATLAEKAPRLWERSGSGSSQRFLVRQSAAEFLAELRGLIWAHFMNRLLRQGLGTYNALAGTHVGHVPLPDSISVEEVYRLKQDACGSPAGSLSRAKRPDASMNMVGAVHCGLRHNGAEIDGSAYRLNGQRIRVLNAQGHLLTQFRGEFEHEPEPFWPVDVVVCVGAKDDGGVPLNIARANKANRTIVRPLSSGEWMTEDQAAKLWREV
jgi:hypothetical protein